MINIHTQQHIRFITVEKPTSFVVYAILLETTGNETIAVSQPKIIKIIAKKGQLALKGSTQATRFVLPSPIQDLTLQTSKIASPYFAMIFGSEASNFIIGLAAQPPTK